MAYDSTRFTAFQVPTVNEWNQIHDNTDALKDGTAIDDGAITGPQLGAPVAFSAYRSAAFNTGSTSPVLITLDAEDYDDGSNFNTTTGQFTAPYAGRYSFSGAVTIVNTGGQVANCSIYVNGTERKRGLQINSAASSHTQLYNVASDISLAASDTVELRVTTATAARDILVGSPFTYLSGHLIGRTD